MTLPITSVLHQQYIEATVVIQSLSIVQSVSDIASVSVKIQQSRSSRHRSWWLFDEISHNASLVLCRQGD